MWVYHSRHTHYSGTDKAIYTARAAAAALPSAARSNKKTTGSSGV
jgi:hypothetical protein